MFIGYQKQWQFLKRGFEQDSLPHGLLFLGQEGLGKKTLALRFIKFLGCRVEQATEKPCGVCSSCRSFSNNLHPDFVLIEPQAQKEIPIAEIKDLIWKLSLRPALASYKVVIINDAHRMNFQSQNCLLKTLEEPRGRSFLILITSHPERLLPTIRSRLQELKFYPLSSEEMTQFLKENDCPQERIKPIISLSLGRPGRALTYLREPKRLEKEARQIKDLVFLLDSDLGRQFKYIHSLSKKDSLKEILEVWIKYLREVLLLKVGDEREIDLPVELIKFSLAKLKKIIQGLERINFLLATQNVNKRLVLENLILEM